MKWAVNGHRTFRSAAGRRSGCRRRLVEDDRLGLQIRVQPFRATFPADPRLLEATERDAEVRLEPVVSDGAGADAPPDRIGALRIVREDGAIETVDRVVRDLD